MGYRIDYQPVKKVRNAEKRTAVVPALTALFLLLFFFLVFSLWPQGGALLQEMLIPGDPDVTIMALDTFARELQEGEEFQNALEVFCRTILKEEQLASG